MLYERVLEGLYSHGSGKRYPSVVILVLFSINNGSMENDEEPSQFQLLVEWYSPFEIEIHLQKLQTSILEWIFNFYFVDLVYPASKEPINGGGGGSGVRLFGVQLHISTSFGSDCSSSSTPALSPPPNTENSDDPLAQLHPEKKKGVPWSEEERRMFVLGLEKLGKGDWKGISRSFVTSRTPTQVASHAQKYFLRQGGLDKKKRRSSLFDMPVGNTMGDANSTVDPTHEGPGSETVPMETSQELDLGLDMNSSDAHDGSIW